MATQPLPTALDHGKEVPPQIVFMKKMAIPTPDSSQGKPLAVSKSSDSNVEKSESRHMNTEVNVSNESAQICLACSTIFKRSFPDYKYDTHPTIPTVILQGFWNSIVGDIDPVEITNQFEFFRPRSITFNNEKVECLELNLLLCEKYYEVVFGGDTPKFKKFGTTREEIHGKCCEALVESIENKKGDINEVFGLLFLPSLLSTYDNDEALSLLTKPDFIARRLQTLGVTCAIDAFVGDCESTPGALPTVYNIVASELQVIPCQKPETRVQIGRAFLSLANSLQSQNFNGLSLYFDALSKFESILNHKCTGSLSPIPDSLLELSQMEMAETLHHLGNLCGQIEYFNRELQIQRPLLGKHHPLVGNTLHCIGVLHQSQGNYNEALIHFQGALTIRRLAARGSTAKKEMELRIAETLVCEGEVLSELGNKDDAKQSLKEAHLLYSMNIKRDCEEVASMHHKLGCIEEDMGHLVACLAQFGEALRIRRLFSETAGERERLAETLCCMARIYRARGEVGFTIECYREALDHKKFAVTSKVKWMREWYKQENARSVPMPFFHGGRKNKWTATLSAVRKDAWGDVSEDHKKEVAALLQIMTNIINLSIDRHGKDNLVVSNAYQSMGEVYLQIGFCNKAMKALENASKIRTNLSHEDDIMATISHQKAKCHMSMGHYQDAIKELKTSLDIRKRIGDEDQATIADLWYDIGNAQSALSSPSALKSLNKALSMREAMDSPVSDLEIPNVKYCLGVAHVHLSNYEDAISLLVETTESFQRILGKDHTRVAHCLYYHGQALQALNLQNQESEILDKAYCNYRAARGLYIKYPLENEIVIAHVHHSLGTIWNIREEYGKAKSHFQLAVKTYKKYNGGNNLLVAAVLNHLGVIFTLEKEDIKSLMCLQEALRIRRQLLGSDHLMVADILHNVGGVHAKFRRFNESMKCYEKVLEIRTEKCGKNDLSVAKVLNNLGILHARLGQYDKARSTIKRALKIQNKKGSDNTEGIASSLYNLGNVLARTQKYDAAVRCYEESLSIRRTMYGDSHPTIADMMHNLGMLCEERDDVDAAKKWYNEALKVKRLLLGPDSLTLASTLLKIGNLQKCRGDFDGALTCFQKVLKVQKRHYGPDHVDLAQTYMCLGSVKKVTGCLDMASMYAEEALRIREENFGELHSDVASSLFLLGQINELVGNQKDAFVCFGNAYRIYKARSHEKNKRERKRVTRSLKKIVAKMGDVAFCDALIVTGDCCFSMEGMLTYLMKSIQTYITMSAPSGLLKNKTTPDSTIQGYGTDDKLKESDEASADDSASTAKTPEPAEPNTSDHSFFTDGYYGTYSDILNV